MRIALVSDWFRPRIGGIEGQIADLALALRAAGHSPEVICATPGPEQVSGIRVHRLAPPALVPHFDVAWRPAAYRGLAAVLGAGRFDIVHAHSAYSPVALAACGEARKVGIPSVLTSHSLFRGAERHLFRALNAALGWAKWPDRLTAVSQHAAADLTAITGRDVSVLPNGLKLADWPCAPSRGSTVVSVLRLMPRKRAGDLIAVAERLAAGPVSVRPQFRVIGDGPEATGLRERALRLPGDQKLEFLGALDGAAIRQVFGAAALFVLPTPKEALSIASLEALASGLPVVARRGSGVEDLVSNGENGLLVGSVAEMAEAVGQLLADDKLRRTMAKKARPRAMAFDWSRVLPKHVAVYEEVIAAHRAGG